MEPRNIAAVNRPLDPDHPDGCSLTISVGEPWATATLKAPDGTVIASWPCLPQIDNEAIVIEILCRLGRMDRGNPNLG